jgi:hypothetical protein
MTNSAKSPRVWNVYDRNKPADAVYCGRPSPWGNPWSHLSGTLAKYKVATREIAIAKYRQFLIDNPDFRARVRAELRGKDLACFCAPLPCHCDTLLKVANAIDPNAPAEPVLGWFCTNCQTVNGPDDTNCVNCNARGN